MRTLGNILWFILGGLAVAVLWFVFGLLWCVTIVGIPLGLQCFKFGSFMLWPFGRTTDYSSLGAPSIVLNVLWILLSGWVLAVISAAIGIVWCVTIIGIPFGVQSFKFAKLSLMPFGVKMVKA